MPDSVSRIVVVLTFILLTPFGYHILFEMLTSGMWGVGGSGASRREMHLTNVILGLLLVLAWIVVWYPRIRWTRARLIATVLSLAGTVGASAALRSAYLKFGTNTWGGTDFTLILFWFFWAYLWLGSTAFVWRESELERAARIARRTVGPLPCPRCRYDLTGLHEARCPECGTQYTLEQLVSRSATPKELD